MMLGGCVVMLVAVVVDVAAGAVDDDSIAATSQFPLLFEEK